MDKKSPMMNIEERRMIAKLIEILEDIPLDESNPERFIRIRTSMEDKSKQDLVQFLRKSKDVFAWSYKDIPRIDLSVITHHL